MNRALGLEDRRFEARYDVASGVLTLKVDPSGDAPNPVGPRLIRLEEDAGPRLMGFMTVIWVNWG